MLDAYFKSYFATFVLGSLFAGAFLTARITNVFVGRALQPPVAAIYQDEKPVRRTVRRTDASERPPIDAFLTRNLFDAEREDLTPPDPSEMDPEATEETSLTPEPDTGPCDPERCSASSVPANLLATFWAGGSGRSRAVFQATAGGEIAVLGEGDQLLDQATVTSIYRNNVCVSRSGTCEIFSLEQANKKVSATPRPTPVAEPSTSEPSLGEGVRKLGSQEYEIERSEIDNVLSNLNQIARQARIVPSFKDGKSNGFKLFSIRPNSLYSKIGIQNGDIIQKINGYEMNSPDKALEIYTKLKDADSITVDLVRRGKPVTMSYSIR